MRMVARGLGNKEIAVGLTISERTVKTHLHHSYEKLHVNGRVTPDPLRPAERAYLNCLRSGQRFNANRIALRTAWSLSEDNVVMAAPIFPLDTV